MAHHNYYITLEKKLNRAERCKKRGKLHDENRAKAKERKLINKTNTACRMPRSGGDVKL